MSVLRNRALALAILGVAAVTAAAARATPDRRGSETLPARTAVAVLQASWAGLVVPGLSKSTLTLALRAYVHALQRGQVERPLLSIIDYALPSTEKRLWVLDLEHHRVLFHELVAHGKGSGDNEARAFSNSPGSHQSSLGVFRTGSEYRGEHGLSLRLQGLEPGINDRAEERAIVLHGAPYVSEDFAVRWGRLGRSLGCPAVRPAIADSLIETIRNGTLVFACYHDSAYAAGSDYVAP